MKFIDLTGQKFNRLTINKCVGKTRHGQSLWLCKCECGNKKIVTGNHLKNGHTKSCGCSRIGNDNGLEHGHSKKGQVSKTYNTWQQMIQRCTNPNHFAYKDYGGRGIAVCKRWQGRNGFINFLKDMGESPREKSLDRMNNNKLTNSYSLNCRWSTRKEQANNRRSNLDKKLLIVRKHGRILKNSLSYLRLKDKNKIGFSKYLPYNSKQLCDHLENIIKSQNNYCPMCKKSYNEIKHDVDHIIPTSMAKTKEELLKLFDLNNLSLLCFCCNRYIKRNK